jgi:F-type H+-transporting ATPase subunit delta
MRGVSARSLRAVGERLERQLADGADAASVGAELFSVAALLDVQPTLRRVWSDPATPDEAKEQMARSLLSGKVSDATIDMVAAAVTARWAASRDIADALEQLSVLAQVFDAEQAGQLDELEDELFRFNRIVAADPQLRAILLDRGVDLERRRALVHALLADRASQMATRLVEQALSARHRAFDTVLTDYQQLAADRRSQLVATVTSAVLLTEDERSRLATALERMYGRAVHLNLVVDPSVVGGVRVSIGDEVIDGTVESRLSDAKRRLTG